MVRSGCASDLGRSTVPAHAPGPHSACVGKLRVGPDGGTLVGLADRAPQELIEWALERRHGEIDLNDAGPRDRAAEVARARP